MYNHSVSFTCSAEDIMPYYLLNSLGSIQQIDYPVDGLDKTTLQLPQGVYTTFRTYESNKALHFPQHLDRLEESARLAGHSVRLKRRLVRQAIRLAIQPYQNRDCRVRLVVDLSKNTGDIYVLIELLHAIPEEAYRLGVKAIFSDSHRNNPMKKGTEFIAVADMARSTFPPDVNEALMVSERGEILEGLSSNFYAVKDGTIYTASDHILNGITRSLVLEEAHQANIPVIFEGIQRNAISQIQEAFITSASRGVLPVVSIGEQKIGVGEPGSITRRLYVLYNRRIALETRTI